MQFPDNYFDDEVRDGFFVPGLMKRAWAAQLEVLNEVALICKKHNIRWFADCGTLIGAVRHGGFVPWDDDLDICMLREDYDRFVEIAKRELPEDYRVLNAADTEDFENMLTRIANSDRIRFEKEATEKYHYFMYSAGIDVFPLDYIAADEEAEQVRKNLLKIVISLMDGINDENRMLPEMQQAIVQVEELCNVKFDMSKPIRLQYMNLLDKLFSVYTSDEADEVALMMYWVQKDNHRYKLEWFKDTVELPFENTYIQAPAMYDAVLKTEYGDYMRIVQAGGIHDYPFYVKQEKHVIDSVGHLPYRYYFSEKDLYTGKKGDCAYTGIKLQLIQIINVLSTTQDNIIKLMIGGETELAGDFLMQCQNAAINMGNMIEQNYGEGHVSVKELEAYCEELYTIYTIIGEDICGTEADIAGYGVHLTKALQSVLDSIDKNILQRREVVFVTYKAAMWDSLDGLWRECRREADCDVYVIPVPYYYKAGDGTIVKECYEGMNFPQEVKVTGYNDYDFVLRHPDTIYFQCPYDKYNMVFSVHPFAYSTNIRQFTDNLVFVQPFVVDEIKPGNEKARLNIVQYFCNPAIMCADRVIVQSDDMKQILVEELTKFTGEHTRHVWEKKLDGGGVPSSEQSNASKREHRISQLPDEWKALIYKKDGSRRKIVLYNNSVNSVLENKEEIIQKLCTVLNVFKKNSDDIVLVWRHNPFIKATIEKTYPNIWKEYSRIVEQYKQYGWGIYDDKLRIQDEVEICDAYYGDTDSIVQKLQREKVPIMIKNDILM